MKFLIVVDMQNDFITGSLGTKEAEAILPKVLEKIRTYRPEQIFVTQDTHPDNYLETNEGRHLPVAHCIAGSQGHALNPLVAEALEGCHGILVPGGFGQRGLEGKMIAIQYAREHKIPFLGICLGMQMAVIEYARNVLNLRGASSTELDPNTLYPVIDLMADQNLDMLGHTMRLGKYRCALKHDTNSYKAYAQEEIWERHRHRYEFNNDYLTRFEEGGMTIAGKNPDRNLVEIVEIPDHPWYVAVQFHPELKSRPNRPHPLFRDFVGAAIKHQEQV